MSTTIRTRRASLAAAVALPLLLSACGSSSPSSSTPPPAPAVSQARINVTASNLVFSVSPRPGFSFRDTVTVTITESAGLGANMNFFRYTQTSAGNRVEVSEISSADIIALTGSNRLNANSTRTFTLNFDNNTQTPTGILLQLNFTDDRGNNLTASFTVR